MLFWNRITTTVLTTALVGAALPAVTLAQTDEPAKAPPAAAAPPTTPATNAPAAAATIVWSAAANGVQAGLVPLGGVKDAWGTRSVYCTSPSDLFECPNCAGKPRKHCLETETAAEQRRCAVCGVPKTWGAVLVAGEPLRLEVHLKNTGKEACSLYDVRWGEHWRFTFTALGGGQTWDVLLGMPEAERTVESLTQSAIQLRAGRQNAVVFNLGDDRVSFADPERRAPAVKRLPPGTYTVTASYAHPAHEQANTCTYWHGTVTTAPVAIEIQADDTNARFLDTAKYAGFAAVAEVTTLMEYGNKSDNGAKPAQFGIKWKDLLYAPAAVRNAMTGVKALAAWRPGSISSVDDLRAAAELKVGDRILVAVDERSVSFRVRSATGRALVPVWLDGAQWAPWTHSRQNALQAALAPGWNGARCPWCLQLRGTAPLAACQFCQKQTEGKLCAACASQRGACTGGGGACKRTVGSATRDVTFRLWAFDPNGERDLTPRNECRIKAGTSSLPLWIQVQNEKGVTSEFQTPGGGKRFDCCRTMFYLVEGPGLSAPTPAFHVDVGARARMLAPAALQQGSATGQVHLVAGKLFATPGAYTVRAVAGRLVSDPLQVIVEAAAGEQKRTADDEATDRSLRVAEAFARKDWPQASVRPVQSNNPHLGTVLLPQVVRGCRYYAAVLAATEKAPLRQYIAVTADGTAKFVKAEDLRFGDTAGWQDRDYLDAARLYVHLNSVANEDGWKLLTKPDDFTAITLNMAGDGPGADRQQAAAKQIVAPRFVREGKTVTVQFYAWHFIGGALRKWTVTCGDQVTGKAEELGSFGGGGYE